MKDDIDERLLDPATSMGAVTLRVEMMSEHYARAFGMAAGGENSAPGAVRHRRSRFAGSSDHHVSEAFQRRSPHDTTEEMRER